MDFVRRKKGHYDITGFFFDLYCTPGPLITEKFQVLQKKYKSFFLVKETGWPKLDDLFKNVNSSKK